jgi:heptosyltransferase-2
MKIFIELPTWLGDTIMATPAIEEILKQYPKATITLFGSFVSTEALRKNPRISHVEQDLSKQSTLRWLWLFKKAKQLGPFDIAFSFRSSKLSSFFLFFLGTKQTFQYKKHLFIGHQVEKYFVFVEKALHVKTKPENLKLYQIPFHFEKPTLGINPGATYGSAKRWYPEEFAKVANHFSTRFDIIIFGGPNEIAIAAEVEHLIDTKVTNIAGKTTITELIEKIAGLSLFVTNDSGPMHIAAAYDIPTVTLFGPTRHTETCAWNSPNSYILSHNLSCAPCMKRECLIKTHVCMRGIKAEEVIVLLERHLSLDT